MATWASLEIDPTLMRGAMGNESDGKSDNELKAIKKTIAKQQLKDDITDSVNPPLRYGNTTDMTNLDSLTDKYYTEIQTALMYLQLYWYYYDNSTDRESRAYIRMLHYQKLYNNKKTEFSSYTLNYESATKILQIRHG
jgi:hypothetical protein